MKNLNLPFYLTGGTAVSRGYYHHRYSDDLDFFVNDCSEFRNNLEKALGGLDKAGFNLRISDTSSPDFLRLYINSNINGLKKNGLKIDFVNDVCSHFGKIHETDVYYKTDSIRNILSNKFTALYRVSVKDIIDIYEIAKHYPFSWQDIVKEGNDKQAGIDLKEVVTIFNYFSDEEIMGIKWINKPVISEIKKGFEQIAKDMILMTDNSLCQKKIRKRSETGINTRSDD